MKKFLILCLVVMGLTACADKGPVAPKEGRQSIGSVLEEPLAAEAPVQTEKETAVQNWAFADKNAANKKPHILMKKNVHLVQSVSIGKGIDEDNQTFAGPIVWGNVIYTLDSHFNLQATDLKTRKILWRKELGEVKGSTAKSIGLSVYHKKLYAVAGNGLIIAMNLKGKQLWQRNLNAPLRSGPILDNNRLFVSSIYNQLFALNADDGKDLWAYDGERAVTNFFGMGNPAVQGTVVVMPTTSGRVNAFDTATGMMLWSQDMWTQKIYNPILDIPHMTAAPVIDGDKVYLVGNAGKTGLYHLKNGDSFFTTGIGGRETPALSGNALFVISNQKEIMALDKISGRLFWRTTLNSPKDRNNKAVWYGPLLINQSVLIVSDLGDIVFYNVKTGQEERREKQSELFCAPVIVGETMLFLTKDGDLLFYQ